ncbi:MAG: CoB-CoM heterodisulfide reductase HdrA2 [Candidatus Baldrarchaeia archaeon]
MSDEVRIGVYVCHCGKNIGGIIDCEEVAKFASTLPGVVVSKHLLYTCSEVGQREIQEDIKKYNLNRVVIACCTPRLHEETFRRCVEKAGLNKYLLEIANIREHCSWVHLWEPEKATKKAKDLVKMAVAKARLLKPLEDIVVPVENKALVIGGGVAGIQAALDLADMGFKVYLVERAPSIGGRMAQLDKTFPTLDCSICILAPKMAEVYHHPNVEILAYSEILEISGYVGNFTVKVLKKPRYVIEDKCTACGECANVCPVIVPNEFDVGLSPRKAIYIPFAQAIPPSYLIDMDHCIKCRLCEKVCEPKAIDFNMQPEIKELKVGVIIVATGFDTVSKEELKEWGYGIYENVITTMEFERLTNAAGPTGGELVRPSDGKRPKHVVFIQCVGTRDKRTGRIYCSYYCCMETLKSAFLIKEHWPDTEITVLYMDIRAFGKGFEELYRRVREFGVRFIRAHPSEIREDKKTKNLLITFEDTLSGRLMTIEADLVILSVGAVPSEGSKELLKVTPLQTGESGFFLEAHPKLRPVDTATDGIFICGGAEGPKDIKDSVTQASAAAARAARLLVSGQVVVEGITSFLAHPEVCKSCGLCQKVCPFNAITIEELRKTPPTITLAACKGCGTCVGECPTGALDQNKFTDEQIMAQIEAALEENPEEKIIAFCCNWCSYAGADFAGVSRIQYPPNVRIIRVMCSGRVKPEFIYRALELGAGMVLWSGCHPGDCHYISGNLNAQRRYERLIKQLEKLGVDTNRVRLAWFSAAEGLQFAQAISEMVEYLKKIPREEIERTKKVISEWLKKRKKRKIAG